MFWRKKYVHHALICILLVPNAFHIGVLHVHFKKVTKTAKTWPHYKYLLEQGQEDKSHNDKFCQQGYSNLFQSSKEIDFPLLL